VIGEITAKAFRDYMAANPIQAEAVGAACAGAAASTTGPVAVETPKQDAPAQDSSKSLSQVTSVGQRQGKGRKAA
jgi:hypothetical protein